MDNTLFVIARITAKPGHVSTVRDAVAAILAPTRAEAGCIRYDALSDNGNDHCFVIQEQWQSKAALNDHMLTEHFKILVDCIGPIASIEISELSLLA